VNQKAWNKIEKMKIGNRVESATRNRDKNQEKKRNRKLQSRKKGNSRVGGRKY